MNRTVATLTGCVVLLAAIGGATVAHAQSPALFENVTLSPRFSPDQKVIRGIGGGSVAAREVADRAETPTGACLGFTDSEPDHTLELTAFFNYLRLQVNSAEDTTLIVKGPGGTWCNDDFEDKNPGIAGQWLAGRYQIWVASYRKGQTVPYTIRFSETR